MLGLDVLLSAFFGLVEALLHLLAGGWAAELLALAANAGGNQTQRQAAEDSGR